eukprot:4043231-Ditylum_brightwellii.AAC.2
MMSRIVLVLIIMANWATALLDVKGAYLNGMFRNREHLFMTVPQGFESYKCNKADLCMAFKWVDSCLVLWITWVDDCLNTGPEQEVKKAMKEMHSMFECKD